MLALDIPTACNNACNFYLFYLTFNSSVNITVNTYEMFFDGEGSGLDFSDYDYIVDCIDSVGAKVKMAAVWMAFWIFF